MNNEIFKIKEEIAFGIGGERYIYTVYHLKTNKMFATFKDRQHAEDRVTQLESAYRVGYKEGQEKTAGIYKLVIFFIFLSAFTYLGMAVKSNIT